MTEDLDRWLAENLMGWHIVKQGEDKLEHWVDMNENLIWIVDTWHPTRHIGQCQQVWEKMRDNEKHFIGWHLEMCVYPPGYCGARFIESQRTYIIADTIEMAVCMAAKQALEEN